MIVSHFERAVAIVLEREGVLSDHAADRGGLTKYGISARAYPGLDIRALTREQAIAIYRADYWTRTRCDELPWGIALALFDCAVNQGARTAIRLLQRSLGVADDGLFGHETMRALRRGREAELLVDFMARRAMRYAESGQLAAFGRGWMRRLFHIHRECLNQQGE